MKCRSRPTTRSKNSVLSLSLSAFLINHRKRRLSLAISTFNRRSFNLFGSTAAPRLSQLFTRESNKRGTIDSRGLSTCTRIIAPRVRSTGQSRKCAPRLLSTRGLRRLSLRASPPWSQCGARAALTRAAAPPFSHF